MPIDIEIAKGLSATRPPASFNMKKYMKEYNMKLYQENREEILQYMKDHYQENREEILQRTKEYYQEHCEEILQYQKKRRKELCLQAMNKLGGPVCMHCGYSDVRSLTIDHIVGLEDKLRKSGSTLHLEIINMIQDEAISKYQVLCRNCNWAKFFEDKEGKERPQYDNKKHYDELRSRAIDKLGGPICMHCKHSDMRILNIDHIDELGDSPRKDSQKIYCEIIAMPQDKATAKYQVLCRNCNYIKYLESIKDEKNGMLEVK